jgi:hypothetical protein
MQAWPATIQGWLLALEEKTPPFKPFLFGPWFLLLFDVVLPPHLRLLRTLQRPANVECCRLPYSELLATAFLSTAQRAHPLLGILLVVRVRPCQHFAPGIQVSPVVHRIAVRVKNRDKATTMSGRLVSPLCHKAEVPSEVLSARRCPELQGVRRDDRLVSQECRMRRTSRMAIQQL